MAIKRNPETGKYYIAPSPPSFYQPKKPSSGSSGGEQSTYNPETGVNVDTGTGQTWTGGGSTSTYSGSNQPSQTSEVIREGLPVSTQRIQAGDVPIKNIQRTGRIAPPPKPTIQTANTFGNINRYQDKYIESLTTKTSTQPEVKAYGGVTLPYGQKDVTWFEPQFGTVTQENPMGIKEVSLIKTLKEQEIINPNISKPTDVLIDKASDKLSTKIIKEETIISQKVIDDSVSKIQSKIDSGEISLKEGKAAIKRIQDTENKKLNSKVRLRFNEEIGDVLSRKEFKANIGASEKFRDTFKTSFSPEFKTQSNIGKAELGADIIAGAISGVAPPIGIAYFGGKTIYKAAKGAGKDTIIVDEQFRDIGRISSKETTEAAFSSLFAVTGGIGYTSKIGSQITALRRAELISKPWILTSKELSKKGDITLVSIKGSKAIGGASAEAGATFPIKVGKKGVFNILGGKGQVDLRVLDFNLQGVASPGKDILKSSVRYSSFGRGAVSGGNLIDDFGNVLSGNKYFVTQGEGYVTPDMWQNVKITKTRSKFWSEMLGRPFGDTNIEGTFVGDKVSLFDFGGVSRKVGEKTLFTGGRITGAKLNLKTFGVSGKFTPEFWGSTLSKGGDDIAYKGYSSFSGKGGAKSSTQFLKDMWTPSQTTVSKQVSKTIPITKTIGEQFGGTTFGASQNLAGQLLEVAPSLVPQSLTLTGLAVKDVVKIKDSTKPIVIPKIDTGIKGSTKPVSDVFSITSSVVSSKTGQDFISSTKQSSATKQVISQTTQPQLISTFPLTSLSSSSGGIGFQFNFVNWGRSNDFIGGKVSTAKSYIPQVKSSGKWKTVGKRMDRQSALSRASRGADLSTSRGMRIKPSNKKPQITGISGWGVREYKFRNYKISNGKRTPLPKGSYIERKNFVGDTRTEISGLNIAKLSKKMSWNATTKKSKKKNNINNKSQWLV